MREVQKVKYTVKFECGCGRIHTVGYADEGERTPDNFNYSCSCGQTFSKWSDIPEQSIKAQQIIEE